MQWFRFDDSRPDDSVRRLRRPGVTHSRAGLARIAPHHTSPPKDPMYFADFRARMIERFAPAQSAAKTVAA